jgi:hypothetical protein
VADELAELRRALLELGRALLEPFRPLLDWLARRLG